MALGKAKDWVFAVSVFYDNVCYKEEACYAATIVDQ